MTLTLVEKAHRRRGPFLGVTILKCDDAFWQQVVAIAIEHSDAVIVDVTELTENVAWELRTCLEKKAPRAVVLAYAAEGTTAPDTGALPAAVRAKLDAVVGLNRVAQCTVLLYPPAQPSIGPSRGVA
ncbi:MAG: hypothetical protein JO121_00945 [Deltaproteobacteria bacterium]|jgi:hypothetical protein|nr:hypothetical protein [Deltaproteobacteria bacterium]